MATLDRIPLQRNTAIVTERSIAVHPSRGQVLGPLIELGLAAGAVVLIVLAFDALPLALLMVLVLLAMILGPIGMLGLVYSVIGSGFVMDRDKRAARWQQGFLGLGIGTTEYVPFRQIARVEVAGDYDEELSGGEEQDVVHWDVRLVTDGRALAIGTVAAARPVADLGLERANRLARAVAEMAGVELREGSLPASAVTEATQAAASPAPPAAPRRRRRRVRRAPPPREV